MATTVASLDALRMSLPDVARLAGVQRPVVSMWRARSARTSSPFPAPVTTDRGRELFDADDIVMWLEGTGRGRDGQVRLDAAAFAGGSVPGRDLSDDATFDGLTALLCLAEVSGRRLRGLSDEDLLDLADEYDPDDGLLYSEVDRLGTRRRVLAAYSQELTDAAFSVAGAFETLLAGRRRAVPASAAGALTEPGLRLLSTISSVLADPAGDDPLHFAVSDPGDGDLVLALAAATEGLEFEVRLLAGAEPPARSTRRRLRVHRVPLAGHPALNATDATRFATDSLVVAVFPTQSDPKPTAVSILAAINELAIETSARQRVLIVAPAAVLTDRLAERAARRSRDDLLRTDRLRALVRLPAGLVVGRSRQQLALCCLGPDFGDLPDDERRVAIGDLSGRALDRATIDDLATDLRAAMEPGFARRIHQPAFVSPALVRTLRTATGSLLPVRQKVGQRPATVGSGAATVITLGNAVASGRARMVPGLRMSEADDLPDGGLMVLDPARLAPPARPGGRAVDRLGFEERYPHARTTQPGDVVFVAGGRACAIVDVGGGSVVPAPAKIIRPTPDSGLLSRVIAADINARASASGGWRSWEVRLVPTDQAGALDARLADLDARQQDLGDQIAALDRDRRILLDAVTTGTAIVEPQIEPDRDGTTGPNNDRAPVQSTAPNTIPEGPDRATS